MSQSPNAPSTNSIVETPLVQGNRAFRSGQFSESIRHYVQVLLNTPTLSKTIATNMAMAKQKYRSSRKEVIKPSVAVCGWDLSHNAAGRVYTLAQLYQTFADTEIIGSFFPKWGRDLWEPIRGTSIPVHSFVVEDEQSFLDQAVQLVVAHPYDIVHLSKPRISNIFIGILYKLIWDAKVLVDIDDEELAFVGANTPISVDEYVKDNGTLPELRDLSGKDWTRLAVGLANGFDGITVSNPALQQRYGGEIIRHARDEKQYQPSPELKRKNREKFGIGLDKKVVLFFGTPRKHKGLLEVADAIASLKRNDVVFVIIGDFPDPSLKTKLLEKKEVEFFFLGNQPFAKIPEVVALGDCCVLLLDPDSPVSQFQIPAKLSDALGLGLTVLAEATPALADLIVEGAVTVIDRGRFSDQLLQALIADPSADAAASARHFFLHKLSFAVNGLLLEKYVTRVGGQSEDNISANTFACHFSLLHDLNHPVEFVNKNKINCDIKDKKAKNIVTDKLNGNGYIGLCKKLKTKKARLVVYTAITGKYDNLINPDLIVDEWDYVLFTDNDVNVDTVFEIRKPPLIDLDPVRMARYIKVNPHIVLKEYEYSLWIDGNVLLKSSSFEKNINNYIERKVDAVFRKHPVRSCMYDEIEKCKELLKDDFGLMTRQLKRYKNENIPEKLGLFETNVVLRRNCKEVSNFNDIWWDEISHGSRRDQLSVMYSIYKNAINYEIFPEKFDIRSSDNEWYQITSHTASKQKSKFCKVIDHEYENKFIQKNILSNSGFYNTYSCLKIPYKVRDLVLRIRNLGFQTNAVRELFELYENTTNNSEKEHSAWQLVLFYLDEKGQDSNNKIDILLNFLEKNSVDNVIKRYLPIISSIFKRNIINNKIYNDDLYVDACACNLDISKIISEKQDFLNSIFDYYGLNLIRILYRSDDSIIDSIFPNKPPHRWEFIVHKEKVTIIVPAYNSGKTIETSIVTLIGQTWSNLEIIVVDDLSTDNTVEIIESIAKKDKRIKLIKQDKNCGPYVARNKACEIATGDYITVADADDWHHPQKIELQASQLRCNNEVVANVACWIRADNNLQCIRRGNPYYRHLNISSLMFRRNYVLSKLGGWDSVRFGGDSEFYKRLLRIFGKNSIVELNAVTSIGRVESGSLTNSESFGYNGYPYGARREYLETYDSFHSKANDADFKYDVYRTPYPLPRVMHPSFRGETLTVTKVFLGDFRREDDADAAIDFVSSCESRNISYSLVQINSYVVDPRLRVHDKLRKFLHKKNKTLSVFGENITSSEAIIYDVGIFANNQSYLPKIEANDITAILMDRSFLINIPHTKNLLSSNIKTWISGNINYIVYNDTMFNNERLASFSTKNHPYKKDYIFIDIADVDNFIYYGSKKIAIVMPCIDRELGEKTADIMIRRAGIDCTVVIAFDSIRQGFIKTLNAVSEKIDARFICYVAQDAFPGRNWLKIAYRQIEDGEKGLLGFNDGKWEGRIASFGMVRKEWIQKFYENSILCQKYKSHKADNEITVIARADNKYIYCADSVLIECDYGKDSGGSNLGDDKIFITRFNEGFDNMFDLKILSNFKTEYKIK